MFEPGTSIQVLVAILIMLCHLLVVKDLKPYVSDGEDYSSFLSSLTLTLTTLGAFALITDNPDPTKKTFDSDALAYVMVGISVSCITSQIGIAIFFDCGLWDRMRDNTVKRDGGVDGKVRSKKNKGSTSSAGGSKTQVMPVVVVKQEVGLSTRAWTSSP